ncbi:DUF3667 domain-containing protein [Cesiribacter andamanensis]|uniref:DUF3667 domain-containing protein n=1 Tax=Cesiribacter andamanensis AMV16 TaxID=1279009 RepID=M7N1Z9_9BACT|nr:DUF3667 domain-containing protein [Cesiribacter andamanensis]EMR02703.1 hypothetical protein ADICEAN_02180 [Cesiribacter andamanensis AMV16]
MGFKTLLDDFFSNYIAFDSKLARSTVPFLFRPGYLTRRFNEGKRITFVHPLRLYFIISFIFFFLLASLSNSLVEENKFSLKAKLARTAPAPALQPGAMVPADSLPTARALIASDSLNSSPSKGRRAAPTDQPLVIGDDEGESRFFRLMQDDSLTDEQVMDSLKVDKEGFFGPLSVHQGRKLLKKDVDVFLPYLIKNLSIMMFLMLPVFAFFLWILYRRQEPFYISHVIHALHMHAFSFLLLSLVIAIELFGNSHNLLLWAFVLITLYAFLSIKRVYGQGWVRTFFKFNLLGFFYFMVLNFAIFLEVGISFMLF